MHPEAARLTVETASAPLTINTVAHVDNVFGLTVTDGIAASPAFKNLLLRVHLNRPFHWRGERGRRW